MNLEQLQSSGRIIYEYVGGSVAYGTNTPQSDIDLRGIYYNSMLEYVSLKGYVEQINNPSNDIIYYTLKRYFDLMKTANPNMIESLFISRDCIKYQFKPIMGELFANRKLFISKKAYYTHAEYSRAQIGKAKGANKKVHNPQPETMPKKEDFCRVIDMRDPKNLTIDAYLSSDGWSLPREGFPFRPVPLKETGINLSQCHVSSLEHAPYVFRLYLIGKEAKGVFRGDQMLCCESITIDQEACKFIGLLLFNKEEFERALKDWHSYWDWKKNRNDNRWVDQEKGVVDFDCKNMQHCVRLIMSAENILEKGEPLVRFTGKGLAHLRAIRDRKFTYEQIMEEVAERMAKLEKLLVTSTIPEHVDMDKLDELFKHLMKIGERKLRLKL